MFFLLSEFPTPRQGLAPYRKRNWVVIVPFLLLLFAEMELFRSWGKAEKKTRQQNVKFLWKCKYVSSLHHAVPINDVNCGPPDVSFTVNFSLSSNSNCVGFPVSGLSAWWNNEKRSPSWKTFYFIWKKWSIIDDRMNNNNNKMKRRAEQ